MHTKLYERGLSYEAAYKAAVMGGRCVSPPTRNPNQIGGITVMFPSKEMFDKWEQTMNDQSVPLLPPSDGACDGFILVGHITMHETVFGPNRVKIAAYSNEAGEIRLRLQGEK